MRDRHVIDFADFRLREPGRFVRGDSRPDDSRLMSADFIVDNLWAITMVVLCSISFSIAACTSFSDSVSNADVASSSINIGGFFHIALAIHILWR